MGGMSGFGVGANFGWIVIDDGTESLSLEIVGERASPRWR
jgi:hypothetical protein